ncbi:ABC transporter permease [Pseudomonadota bacterium]
MIDSFYIAWKYLLFSKARSATLVACITLIAVLPLALEIILDESEHQLVERAVHTPLLVGARGSALDLVMNSLYFADEVPELISLASADEITATDLAVTIPLYVRFQARGFQIVGTTLDYFDFRQLRLAEGTLFGMLGECIIGAAVASQLGLKAGDSLLSSPETVFDLAGVYPLKMRVAGVLAPTHSADDLAVLVDVKTAWVIEGLAHGHEDVARSRDSSVIIERSESNVTANAKLMQYTEITATNIDSFHLHGNPASYPLTAVIALPRDDKAAAILRGRYQNMDTRYQIVPPADVIDTLMSNIFRIRNVLDAVILFVGLATLMALVLVFALSLRLRQREIDTIFKLGCSRMTIAQLLGAEVVIIAAFSTVLCLLILLVVSHYDQQLVRELFI